ncbi:MAG: glycogen debranching enzyme [Fibrobacteres bacterium]|nr:glycogen debranching enzyme [Fibrobacterota bacterium]
MPATVAEELIPAAGTLHPARGPFAPLEESLWSKETFALGARLQADGGQAAAPATGVATFAVYSRHAVHVLLEIYDQAMGSAARFDYWMAKGGDDIWRAKLSAVPAGALYGYRCWGPNWDTAAGWTRGNSMAGFKTDVDASGNRFNPNKLLIDPYASEFSHDRETPEMTETFGHNAAMYGSGPAPYTGVADRHPPVARREFDTGPWAPKAILIHDRTSFGRKPRIPQKDAIIYEAHVKGMTRHPSSAKLAEILKDIPGFEGVAGVPDSLRGTYAGAGYMAKYLKALGYTTVELLPVHEFANDLTPEEYPGWDRRYDEPPHGNYWGYMTYGFFAPDLRYAHDKTPGGPTREFKQMVKAFHDEGMEVYLDVVYNHSGEGGLWDGTGDTAELLFLRGFDNAEYYALTGNNRFYWDSTGCGNNLDASKVPVQNLVKDSIRHWSLEMGVDGFRFDLATVLGRSGANFDFEAGSKLLKDIADLAEKEKIEVIAEAWDLAGYHVGDFPKGWAEWNGIYRDAMRRFLKGDGNSQDFAKAVNGDYSHFQDQGGPHKSVNFLTAHDGFTLMDLVSYNGKNNGGTWPFGPTDGGTDDNLSWDSGGDQALRRQRLRNFLAVQFFSRGVPMTCAGDEFARTQNGNNNPYKLDSIGMWQNYGMIATPAPNALPTGGTGFYHDNYGRDGGVSGKNGLFLFARYVIGLRKTHHGLRQDKFADFKMDAGNDVTFFFRGPDGAANVEDGNGRVHWRIDGSAVGDTDFLILANMHSEGADFSIPAPEPGKSWRRLIDTAAWAEALGNFWPADKAEAVSGRYWVHPNALVVLQETA